MAEAKIGPILVHQWIGDRPYIPRAEAVPFNRQGNGKTGHVVLPPRGKPITITTVTYCPNSAAVESGLAQCQSMVGRRYNVLWNGLDFSTFYGVEFVVEDVEILRQQLVAFAMGGGPHGPSYAFRPGIELRLNWRLTPEFT